MPAKRKKPDAVLKCVIPAIRVYPEELERIKQASAAQRINISDLVRSILFSAPILSQSTVSLKDKKKESLLLEHAGLVREGESITNDRRKVCIHGHKVFRGATDCFQCANFGVKYRE